MRSSGSPSWDWPYRKAPSARGSYVPAAVHNGLCFAAGQLAFRDGDVAYRGKLGADVSLEDAQEAARLAVLNALAAFAQPDAAAAHTHLHTVVDMLRPKFRTVADQLLDTEHDVLAYAAFPRPHWRRIWSTNPLER